MVLTKVKIRLIELTSEYIPIVIVKHDAMSQVEQLEWSSTLNR